MKLSQFVAATVLSGVASIGFACDMPPLMAVPPKDQVGDKAETLRAEFNTYYQSMVAYTSCLQAELTAAGGDTAPTLMKTVLVQRNNSAVAEVGAVKKLLDDALGPTVVPASEFQGAGAAPPAEGDKSRRRSN
jgi:hypothetical protein